MKNAQEEAELARAGMAMIQCCMNTLEQASSESGAMLPAGAETAAHKALKRINAGLLKKYDAARRRIA